MAIQAQVGAVERPGPADTNSVPPVRMQPATKRCAELLRPTDGSSFGAGAGAGAGDVISTGGRPRLVMAFPSMLVEIPVRTRHEDENSRFRRFLSDTT